MTSTEEPLRSDPFPSNPVFIQIKVHNFDRAQAFYSAVFGWSSFAEVPAPTSTSTNLTTSKHILLLGNDSSPIPVGCLVGFKPVDLDDDDEPTARNGSATVVTYMNVPDIGVTIGRVLESGGAVVMERFESSDGNAAMAQFSDTEGNVLGLIQPLVNA